MKFLAAPARFLLENLPGLARGLFWIVFIAWAVATATFILMKAIPGGPLSNERKVPESVRKAIEERYHLNDPTLVQYKNYILDAARFEFGPSFIDPGWTVGEIIRQRFPRSALLGAVALLFSIGMAFPLGMGAAMFKGGWPDRLLAIAAAAGVSVPSFILGSLLMYWFSFRFNVFPSSGFESPRHLVLPALALAAFPTAFLARLVRAGLAEVMRSEFILAARARGLSRFRAVLVHALRHTLAPVFAYLGPQAAAIMTGSFAIEKIFAIPGLGLRFVQSIENRNYPMIMGVTLVYTVMLVVFNLLSDVAARMLDPRLRRGES